MKVTNNDMKEKLVELLMEQCPYKIPEGEEEQAKEILRDILFSKAEPVVSDEGGTKID